MVGVEVQWIDERLDQEHGSVTTASVALLSLRLFGWASTTSVFASVGRRTRRDVVDVEGSSAEAIPKGVG